MLVTSASSLLALGLAVQQAAATVSHLTLILTEKHSVDFHRRAGPMSDFSLLLPTRIISATSNKREGLTGTVSTPDLSIATVAWDSQVLSAQIHLAREAPCTRGHSRFVL